MAEQRYARPGAQGADNGVLSCLPLTGNPVYVWFGTPRPTGP